MKRADSIQSAFRRKRRGAAPQSIAHRPSPIAHGFTLIEVVISMLLVGGMFVAALTTVATARAGQAHVAERSAALPLAQAMVAELARTPFDDLDKYDGQVESPLPGHPGWSRRVSVASVNPVTLTTTSGDTGVKRITVSVQRGDAGLTQLVTLRARVRTDLTQQAAMP